MLQGHIDTKSLQNVAHDFENGRVLTQNGVLRANGTTLGGDNGIAVALMMDSGTTTARHTRLSNVFLPHRRQFSAGATALAQIPAGHHQLISDSEDEGTNVTVYAFP